MISYLSRFLQECLPDISRLRTEFSKLSSVNLEGGEFERPIVICEGLWIEEDLELLPFLELYCLQIRGTALYIFQEIVLLVLASLEGAK